MYPKINQGAFNEERFIFLGWHLLGYPDSTLASLIHMRSKTMTVTSSI
jgi:hypothetical protein